MKILKYEGFAVSVNNWKDARSITKGTSVTATMYKTAAFREYEANIVASAFTQAASRLKGYVDMRIRVCAWRRVDSDAFIKGLFDALEQAYVVENDNRIRDFKVERAYHKQGGHDTIIVEAFRCKIKQIDWASNAIDLPEANVVSMVGVKL